MADFIAESRIEVVTEGNPPYDLLFRDDFSELGDALLSLGCDGHKICIVTDSNVSPLYLEVVKAQAERAAVKVTVFEFPAGEQNKNLKTIQAMYEHLILNGFDRKDYMLALGGGVVGDMTGYAAATYLRGISFIQVPTTLLSQIDSSIGGKTGVDFEQYKNMVGAFHQPILVYINIKVLKSLPEKQYSNGMGELLKYGISLDADFYEWTLDHMQEINDRDNSIMAAMVTRCCQLKREIVENDPKDKGQRALLNFGHTLGHAIEKLEDFTMLHGECVVLGTIAAAYISWQRGNISEEEFYEIRDMNVGFGLPISLYDLEAEEVVRATRKDKKMVAGQIQFILLEKLGQAYVDLSVTDQEMLDAVQFLKNGF